MKRASLSASLLVSLVCTVESASAGVFFGATSTSLPSGLIMHPAEYTGSSSTAVVNTVCFNPATLPTTSSGTATETQVDNALKKAVATFNAQRYGNNNYATSNNDLSVLAGTQYDLESTVLHEIGHCVGLGHPTIAIGISGSTANATTSRADTGGSYDLDDGADNVYGSKDDLRGDNTNLYWFYKSSNDPLAYPGTIDTSTFSVLTTDLPSGSTWPANANINVANALGYSQTDPVMSWQVSNDTVRRRFSAEDLSTLRLAQAGKDGIAGNSDDYSIQLVYDSTVSSCDITVQFSASATSLAACSANALSLGSNHYALFGTAITVSTAYTWYLAQSDNTTLTVTDASDPSTLGSSYTVNVSVARGNGSMSGAPSGTVLVSDGSNTCTATLSGSTSPATGSCTMPSASSAGSYTLTGTYLGYREFDSSADTEAHTIALPAATISVSDSPDPTAIAVSYTVQASLSGSSGTPTGTVSFSDGSASCGPVTISGGVASCNLTSTSGGSKTITASYSGDSNYRASTASTGHTVSKYTPSISLTDSPDPSTPGGSITATTTVSGAGSTPTGTMTIEWSDGAGCSGSLSSGSFSCARSNASTAGSTVTLTATYDGDSNYNLGTASTTNSVRNATTTTISSDTPDPSTRGAAYTVAVTVVNSTNVADEPTGTVSISDGTDTCSATLTAGTNQSTGSCALTSTTAGSKTLTATYGGSTSMASSAGTSAHTVNKSTPTVTVTDATDPTTVGAGYSVSVTVVGSSIAPSGSVSISDGASVCTVGSLSASNGSGSGSCILTSSSAGSKTLTATYAGDSNYNSASGTAAHTVNKATPAVSVTPSTSSPSLGSAYAVTVQVSQSGGATATGSVTVSDGSSSCASSVTLSNGQGSCNLISLAAGSKTITASYGGDTNYNSASGSSTAVSVAKVNPTVTVSTAGSSTIGGAYTVTISVAHASGVAPTGSVTVSDGSASCSSSVTLASGSGICQMTSTSFGSKTISATYAGDSNFNSTTGSTSHTVNKLATSLLGVDLTGATVVGGSYTIGVSTAQANGRTPSGSVTVSDGGSGGCTISLNAGAGTCSMSSSSAGSKTISLSYSGDSNFDAATASLSHTVNKATPSMTLTDATDPSIVDSAYAVSVTLSALAGTTVTGSVTVSDGSDQCSIALSNSSGSCLLSSSTTGSKTLIASYAGDSNYLTSTATSTHTVNVATPALTVIDSTDPSALGSSYAISAALSSSTNLPPSGTVTVADGNATCIITLSAGSGSCSLIGNSAGSGLISLSYSGDARHASVSINEAHSVSQGALSLSFTADGPDPTPILSTYTARLRAVGVSGILPTGTVTVTAVGQSQSCTLSLLADTSEANGFCDLSALTTGSFTLLAAYAGDNNYPATEITEAHTVALRNLPALVQSISPSPLTVGQTFSIAIGINSNQDVPLGGQLRLNLSDQTCNLDLPAQSGTSLLSFSCSLVAPSAGDLTIMMTYEANTVFSRFQEAVQIAVQRATPSLSLSVPTGSSVLGQSFTVLATLTAPVAIQGPAVISDGLGQSCTINSWSPDGIGQCTLANSQAGTLMLSGQFAGDSNLNAAGASLEHTVFATDALFTSSFEGD